MARMRSAALSVKTIFAEGTMMSCSGRRGDGRVRRDVVTTWSAGELGREFEVGVNGRRGALGAGK